MPPPHDSHGAQICWSADGQPRSTAFDDVYFSAVSGIDESRFVFLQHNNIPERWQSLPANSTFTIAETGFGSGLNFLTAWQTWLAHAPAEATLHFISVEKYPLLLEDLKRTLQLWPQLHDLSQQLLEQYPPVDARGFHRLRFGRVFLTLVFADACDGLHSLLSIPSPGTEVGSRNCGWSSFYATATGVNAQVDAWFLDGFAPAKNPQMWSESLFNHIAKLSHTGTTFATFTAAGLVRRGLQNAGFVVRKTPGFGRKREMICGYLPAPAASLASPERTPSPSWHLCLRRQPVAAQVAIVGAGLAGCHTAFALAQRGFTVTIIDRQDVAAGASGNPQGVVYSKLSAKPGALADFNIAALTFALRFYHQQGLFRRCGSDCGVLQLAETAAEEHQQQLIAAHFAQSPQLVQRLTRQDAEAKLGLSLRHSGLWLPQAGWLNPALLCRQLIDHPNILLMRHSRVDAIVHHDEQWHLFDEHGGTLCSAPAVVIACAHSARRFAQCSLLPVKAIRGQISLAQANGASAGLRAVLCGSGYIAPAQAEKHCLGASFNLHSQSSDASWEEHQSNLQQVAALSPALQNLAVGELSDGRVSFRCTSPDYLPLAGPVPNADIMLERFSAYRSNRKTTIDAPGEYWPGLFVNIGHGSKGLTYTPLCAELISSMLADQPLPVARDMALHLHPSRFLIRDLARKRI